MDRLAKPASPQQPGCPQLEPAPDPANGLPGRLCLAAFTTAGYTSRSNTGRSNVMSESPENVSNKIQYDDFAKVQLRVAKVLEAYNHPSADKLIVLKVDLGTEQRQICAGLRGHYDPATLVGRNIVVVANLAPRMMRGLESNGMLLAASNADHSKVILVTPEADIEPGAAVS